MGLPAHAVIRCVLPLPGERLAAGSDHGLALVSAQSVELAPFPKGARKEARDVLSLAWHEELLHIATSRGHYTWNLAETMNGRGLPKDGAGGFDDLRGLFSTQGRLLKAWRTHLDGAAGPGDVLCFAQDGAQNVYVGTSDGILSQLNGDEIERFRTEGHYAPVRHLAWCQNTLWVAAAGALHRYGPHARESRPGEPLALCSDPMDRLWTLEHDKLAVGTGDWPVPIDLTLQRPWCLASDSSALWIGARGGLYRIDYSTLGSHT